MIARAECPDKPLMLKHLGYRCLLKLGLVLGISSLSGMALASGATVALDAGHTPEQYGAMGATGIPEYRYNRTLSDTLAGILDKARVPVLRTAREGESLSLTARTARAQTAALFISIHHDSIPQDWIDEGKQNQYAGFALFVSEKNPDYANSLACARQISAALVEAGEHPSLYHATERQGENRPLIDKALGIHRFDDLVVLKTATSPAVLIEAGVIINRSEAERLAKPRTIQTLAGAIAKGIGRCVSP